LVLDIDISNKNICPRGGIQQRNKQNVMELRREVRVGDECKSYPLRGEN